jgi:hypothetical protein
MKTMMVTGDKKKILMIICEVWSDDTVLLEVLRVTVR